MNSKEMPLAEAFAARPDRFHLLNKGLSRAGWSNALLDLLEIGCSRGDAAAFLVSEYGYRVTAVELSSMLIEEAKQRHNEILKGGSLKFYCSDAKELPFPDESFDGLYCEAAFSPILEKRTALKEFYRVLKNKGRIILNDFAIHTDPGQELRKEFLHIPCFAGVQTIACYRELFEEVGFNIVDCYEEYGELLRISSWLCKVYDVSVSEIGGYLSQFYNMGKSVEQGSYQSRNDSQERGSFLKKSHLTYCQMIFEKPEK